ncbi:hypothetical protein ACFSR7_35975 [Cohnella sp. GCM10020058]|uniref:hypothetical protein n=1 Tax=Cohnella sp. GCM10020058 TaxID=3317330 RepID=UPI003633C917
MSIGKVLGYGEKAVRTSIDRLVEMKAIEIQTYKKKRSYKILIKDYTVDELASDRRERKPLTPPSKPEKIYIPEEYEFYIRGHYKIISRSELSRRLNISKVTLNQMIIQIGLGR